MLVSCKVKNGLPLFEVHKEGLIMLRKFRNKRLRIIFNITHNADHLEKFNQIFLDQPNLQQSQTNSQTINNKDESSNMSSLTISQYYKQLSQNRVIIFLNVYQNLGNPYLFVIGYLVASVFLYHNHEHLSQDSYLTKLLSSLKRLLEATEVSELQKQIKFKSGCSKKPYFMCLFQNFNEQLFIQELNYHDQFREFYKYQEGKHTLNQSVDTLIDYFPQRSAIQIGDYTGLQQSKNKVKKLGQEYRSQILGRQIFNFEITGSSLQNLCFEMCQVFNSRTTSINLLKIYTKIINNQKTQVLDNLVQRYSNLTNELQKQLPYEPSQLLESLSQIQKYIIEESIADSCNCMLFNEYQQIYSSLSLLMKKRFKSIKETNKELLSNRALTCFEQIEEDQQLENSIRNTNEENATEILEVIQQKILIFIQENFHQISTRDFLTRLINNLLEKYTEYIGNFVEKSALTQKEMQQKISKLESQNRTHLAKCQQLQNQYIYLNSINNQFKQKLLESNSVPINQSNEPADSSIVNDLKKKIIDLQIQINQKNQCINNLAEVLDKFDLEFNRKYYKPKFSNNIQKLLSDVSHKINEIYTVLNELKKTENFYEEINHSFEQKKKQFYEIRDNEKMEQNNLRQKMNQVLAEKKILQEVVQQSRQAINNVHNVENQYKGSIDELQNVCSRLKCSLADTEGELEKYKKALQLVSFYCVSGRIDKLRDFYKVTNDEELKQMLKPIIKK